MRYKNRMHKISRKSAMMSGKQGKENLFKKNDVGNLFIILLYEKNAYFQKR